MAARVTPPIPEGPLHQRFSGNESSPVFDGQIVLRWVLALLCIGAFFAIEPLWVPLVLAAWTAIVVKPLHSRLGGKLGRGRSAAIVTVMLFVLFLTPMVIITLSLVGAAVELGTKLQQTGGGSEALRAFLQTEPNLSLRDFDVRRGMEMIRRHGAGAVNAATTVFGAATAILIALVVFLFGLYTFLVDGKRIHGWLLDNSPLPRRHMARFSDAFVETGKGLFIGLGLTALLQGVIATIGYVIIGVPQALVLGLLTMLSALIPSIGTGLVWAPVAAGLFLADRTGSGIALVVLGCIVSVVDNFARPALSRYGHLQLPMFLVFIAMLGGIGAFGAWGILAGPLFVRLAVEALRIWREEQGPHIELQAR